MTMRLLLAAAAFESALSGAEYLGEIIINFFGLDQPHYQWMVEQSQREKRALEIAALRVERSREIRANIREERQQRRASELDRKQLLEAKQLEGQK